MQLSNEKIKNKRIVRSQKFTWYNIVRTEMNFSVKFRVYNLYFSLKV